MNLTCSIYTMQVDQGWIQPDQVRGGGGEVAHRPMVTVRGATVNHVHDHLEPRTAVFCVMR